MRTETQWTPQRLTGIELLMAWGEGQTLAARWQFGCEAAHDLHPHWQPGTF